MAPDHSFEQLPAKRVTNSAVTLAQHMLPTDANPLEQRVWRHDHEAGGHRRRDRRHASRQAPLCHCHDGLDDLSPPVYVGPVFVGDLVALHARLTWTGYTSMEAEMTVEAENVTTGTITHTSTASLVYAALDEQGRPCPVPPLELVTDQKQRRWREAKVRRAYWLAQRGRP